MTLARPPFRKNIYGVMSGLHRKTWLSSLKSVALTVLDLLAFNAQKFRGQMTLPTPPFRKNFKVSCPDSPWKHSRKI